MILFKSEYIESILNGTKTQTRRAGKKRWNVGSVHQCQTQLFKNNSVFAKVEILDVYEERLGDISESDAQIEGGYDRNTFAAVWARINGRYEPNLQVWVVKFKVVTE